MGIKSFNHISLVVADIERAVAFYTDVFRMKLLDSSLRDREFSEKATGIKGAALKIAYLESAGIKVELIEYIHKTKIFERKSDDETFGHLCFNVEGLKAFYKENEDNVDFVSEPLRIPAGPNRDGYMLYLYDPDYNKIELIERPDGKNS